MDENEIWRKNVIFWCTLLSRYVIWNETSQHMDFNTKWQNLFNQLLKIIKYIDSKYGHSEKKLKLFNIYEYVNPLKSSGNYIYHLI
jgi:hypothetical protein